MNTKDMILFLVVLTVLILGLTSISATNISNNNTIENSSNYQSTQINSDKLMSIEDNNVKSIQENNMNQEMVNNSKSQLKTEDEQLTTTIKINSITSFEYAVNRSITGVLNDSRGNNLSNTEVTINVNNGTTLNDTVFTNSEGKFNFTFNSTILGMNNFTITFAGDSIHKSTTKSSIFYVNKQTTYLSIYPEMMTVMAVGDDMNVTGRLTNQFGEALSSATIIIYVGTTRNEVTTDENGMYSYIYPLTIARNELKSNVTYAGSNIYKSVVNSTWIEVEKKGIIVNINQLPIPVINSTFQVTGSILEQYTNKPLINHDILITTGGINYNAVTDVNGQYNVSVRANEKEGSQRVTVTVLSSLKYDKASDYDTTDVKLLKINTTVNTRISNNVLLVNGFVFDERGIPVNNENILITVNNSQYNIYTDKNGLYSINHTLTSAGKYIIGIYHTYNDVFGTIDLEVPLSISTTSMLILNDTGAIKVGDTLKITGLLKDVHGNLITNTGIVLKINNVNITLTTNDNGVYSYDYESLELKNNITICYDGNNIFNKTITSKIVTLQKGDSKTTVTINNLTNNTVTLHLVFTDANNGKLINTGEFDIKNSSGNIIKTVNNTKGMMDLVLNLNSRGTHIFTINYHGNNNYNPSNSGITFTIEEENTTLTINPVKNMTVGRIVNIRGILSDINGNNIANSEVVININGNNSTKVTTSSAGEYNYKYTTTTVGINNITVYYTGDNTYNSCSNSLSFNLTKGNSNITGIIKKIDVDSVWVNIKIIVNETSNAITEGIVKVIYNENVLTTFNNTSNSTDLQLNLTAIGTYKLTLLYEGSDNYNSSSTIVIFTIEKTGTNMVLKSINPIINKMVNISGILTDSHGNSLANNMVILNINNNIVKLTTSSIGEYKYQYNLTTFDLQNITVMYQGNDKYNASNISTTFKATKDIVNIGISSIKGIVQDTVLIQAVITDNDNNYVDGQVTFKVNGKTLHDLNGNIIYVNVIKGIVESKIVILQGNWINYNNGLTIVYHGTSQYKAKQVNTSLIVTKKDANISINSISAKIGETITLEAYISDNNENVTDGKVVFKINGKTIRDDTGNVCYVNVLNGIARINYELPKNIKTSVITCIYSNTLYKRAEKTTILNIV
ncbi:Ig-like domain-containing protein [Methanosphaera sp. WGK6]|uniref:Ig-like domain-containing protein n=1 Tax=Methanosphaera sp. WGK6 TaxID=1561964 RepID=UPI00084BD56B|nr:Ig-like domain-containing protein [Methanosphaera sp. WGK6]OED30340.1 hypothetical protein NL43_02880 [Methanosphaera sp. WGK6]